MARTDGDITVREASDARFVPFDKAAIEQSIAERFAQQVARHGERLALETAEDALSYLELDHRSNRLARTILERRGGAAEAVVLLMRQGAPLVVAILAVLKAGKFYVPLDPKAPAAELGAQIEASGAAMLVTDEASEAVAARYATPARPLLRADRIAPSASAEDVGLRVTPDASAYVFYTSGTTGTPKGVVDCHRNVLHNVMRYTNALRIGPHDRLTLLQAPHFSGAVSSLFGALLNGAAVFPLDLRRQSIGEIARTIAEHGITIYHSVPAIFERVVATGRAFPSLRLIRLEGDQAARRHVELYRRHFGRRCTLVNGLGTTETGIAHQLFIDHDTALPDNAVPLGYATEDTATLILDESGDPAAPGVVGEIAIRSRYLALGYWRDPERTAAAFRPAPGDPGARIYRTGDLGRLRADGCLEYWGRRDFRTKIRGRWVDTSAIEAALADLDRVADAAVQARELADGNVRLVAYVVAAAGAAPSIAGLRRGLAARLPADAIPARFVVLDALPLNEHFKVDRGALPPPDDARPALEAPLIGPRDPLEEALADIWREVLGLERPGIHDRFFELGGDSLAALQVAQLIEERIEADFPVSAVLEAATIAEMAERVRAVRPAERLVVLRQAGARSPLFCIHDQSGEVLGFRELARRLDDDRPVYGLRAIDVGASATPRIEEIAARYVAEMRQVQPQGPYLVAGNCFGGVIAVEVAQQLTRAGQRVASLVLLDTAFPSGRLRETLGRLQRLWWRVSDLPLGERGQQLVRKLRERLVERGRTALKGGPPPILHSRSLDRALRSAGHRYRPERYDGPATLLRIGEQTNQGGWDRLLPKLEVIELPLVTRAGDADLVRMPYVDRVTELLRLEFERTDRQG